MTARAIGLDEPQVTRPMCDTCATGDEACDEVISVATVPPLREHSSLLVG